MPDTPTDTLIVIPVYNAAPRLPELIARLQPLLSSCDLVFIDDGSTDNSVPLLRKAGLPVLVHPDNRGKGAALRSGFRYALDRDYRMVLTLDADLQHRPEEASRLLAAGSDRSLVLGTRTIGATHMPWPRRLSNNLTSLLISVFTGRRIRDSQSGFRFIPVELLRRLILSADRFDLESELLLKAGAVGFAITGVPVSTVYEGSPSNISHLADTLRFIRQLWRRIWL